MTGAPFTFKVLLDDGTGTFPLDVTAWARSVPSFSRGQQDEMSTVQPGQMQIVFDNSDGTLTPGVGNTNGLELSRQLRLIVHCNGVDYALFTGYIDAAPVTWNDTTGLSAFVTCTVTDMFGRLQRWSLRSMLEQEVLYDQPIAYYTMADASTATGASESSGNGMPSLPRRGGSPWPVFGAATIAGTEGLTAASFSGTGGGHLSGSISGLTAGAAKSLELWVNTTQAPASTVVLASLEDAARNQLMSLVLDTSGNITLSWPGLSTGSIDSTFPFNDGNTHYVVGTFDGTTASLYVDSSLQGTARVSETGASYTGGFFEVGGGPNGGMSSPNFVGEIAQVAVYSAALSSTRIASHYNIGFLTFPQTFQATDLMTRILSYVGLTANYNGTTSHSQAFRPIPHTSGSTVFDALVSLATTEGGMLYVDGSGAIQFRGRKWACPTTVSSVTVASTSEVEADLTFPVDKQFLFNQVTGQRYTSDNSAPSIYAADATSVNQYGAYPDSGTLNGLLVVTDTEVTDAVNWRLSTHKQPSSLRVSTMTWDVMTLAVADAASILTFAQREADILTVNALPSQAPVSGATVTVGVIGVSGSVAADSCSITFNTVDTALYGRNAWQLDSSALGTGTQLFY